MTELKALLAGATGLVGGHLLEQLLASPRHGEVIALTRRRLDLDHPKLTNIVVNYETLEKDLRDANVRTDEAYCALGTTIKKAGSQAAFRKVDFDYETAFARAAREAGATRFALVSSVGANAKSSIFYTRVKGETENAIREIGFPTLQIFRPGVLVGSRGEARPAEQLAISLTPILNLGLHGPMRKYRGISAETVAKSMISKMGQSSSSGIHHYGEMVKAETGD
jgi:uncharacterized protein YbjT (DUF2867 family)